MNIEKYKFIIEEIIHRTEVGNVISKYLAGKKKKREESCSIRKFWEKKTGKC